MRVDFAPGGTQLVVTFPYDQRLVSFIRTVPGRLWHKKEKQWSIPPASLRAMRREAARAGVRLAISPQVQERLAVGVKLQEELIAAKANTKPMPLPSATKPLAFQNAGIRFMAYALRKFKNALLADDMGLGKTFQVLSVAALFREHLQRVLVLCPATLKYTWAAEIDKHYPGLPYVVVDGLPEKRAEAWASDALFTIANYELLVVRHKKDCASKQPVPEIITAGMPLPPSPKPLPCDCDGGAADKVLREGVWDLVIADEIAAYIKNYKAKRTKAAKALHRRFSIGMTGLPLENALEELHSVMDWVMPGLLGPGWLFVREHVVKDQWGGKTGYKGIEQIRRAIEPYYIRRRKADVLKDLPPKVYSDYVLHLSDEEWAIYDTIRNQILAEVVDNPKLQVANILVMMLRLKQAAIDPALVDEPLPHGGKSTKLRALHDIQQGMGERQVVFFTQFAQFATVLGREFDVPVLQGTMRSSRKKEEDTSPRQKMIQEFQRGDYQVFVSTDAGAYGVTLTAADVVVHVDQPWNPAIMRQREDRLHRIGQEESVQVVTLMADKTVDQKIRGILHGKLQTISAVLDEDLDEFATRARLTRAELLAMLGADE
jgi:SNF2 family DNA or RNA helicase